jgi:hypothetical protein
VIIAQLHKFLLLVEDANDVAAGVMPSVRFRRVVRVACDHDAGGVNAAGVADNGEVVVHWIRVCHRILPSLYEAMMITVVTLLVCRAWRIR